MKLQRFCTVAVCLLLAGCGAATKNVTYEPVTTPGARLCTRECHEANTYCQQSCDLHLRTCVDNMQAQALRDYDSYTRAQFAAHQPITLRPRDFEHPRACSDEKGACYNNCESRFQMCYENCGGKVTTTSSCQFFCF